MYIILLIFFSFVCLCVVYIVDIRTYSVLPLNESVGLIEWVPDTVTFKAAVLSFQSNFLNPVNFIAHFKKNKLFSTSLTYCFSGPKI